MVDVLVLSGSPSRVSRTDALLSYVADEIAAAGHTVSALAIRALPAEALIAGDPEAPGVAEAVKALAGAHAVVVGTPVYKAAYTGVLKTFLDLLPQFALAGKTVLPLVTGGSPAHVLVVDYALRPVLNNLGADHITQGWFVLSSEVDEGPDGYILGAAGKEKLEPILAGFLNALDRLQPSRLT